MALKRSQQDLAERLHEIKQLMELSGSDIEILTSVIDNDIFGISVILVDEGALRKLKTEIQAIKLRFLKENISNYEEFKKYYSTFNTYKEDLSFITNRQKLVLAEMSTIYRNQVQKYFEDRGDLMIYRKTVNSFISSKLNNKDSLKDLQEVRGYLLTNYSYQDTLYELGLNPEIGEDGFVKLDKLIITEDGIIKSRQI